MDNHDVEIANSRGTTAILGDASLEITAEESFVHSFDVGEDVMSRKDMLS